MFKPKKLPEEKTEKREYKILNIAEMLEIADLLSLKSVENFHTHLIDTVSDISVEKMSKIFFLLDIFPPNNPEKALFMLENALLLNGADKWQ